MTTYKERVLNFRKELQDDKDNAIFNLVNYDEYGDLVVPYYLVLEALEDHND